MLKKINLTKLLILSFFLPSLSFGLVDYSDDEQVSIKRPSRKKAPPKRMSTASKGKVRSSSSSQFAKNFEIMTNYESFDVLDQKVSKINFNAHFQSSFNVFLDLDYYIIQTDNPVFSAEGRGYQKGNPKFMLGLNWLEFGKSANRVNIDLLVGLSYKSSSAPATSRTDQFVGIQTMKRFNNYVLGLSYIHRMTGAPEDPLEMDIGSIGEIGAEFGAMISSDIQFSLLAKNINIRQSGSSDRLYSLKKNVSFSFIMPKLTLGISPRFSVELGAVFRTDRIKDDKLLIPAKLWDNHGVYGNSIFAGLNVSI